MGKQSAVREGCPVEGQPCTTQAGREALDAGKSLATISTVGFIGGGVLLAGGAAMLLWPRDKNEKGSHASAIRIVPAGPGALLHATF